MPTFLAPSPRKHKPKSINSQPLRERSSRDYSQKNTNRPPRSPACIFLSPYSFLFSVCLPRVCLSHCNVALRPIVSSRPQRSLPVQLCSLCSPVQERGAGLQRKESRSTQSCVFRGRVRCPISFFAPGDFACTIPSLALLARNSSFLIPHSSFIQSSPLSPLRLLNLCPLSTYVSTFLPGPFCLLQPGK